MPVEPPVLIRRNGLFRPPTASTLSRSALPIPSMASGEGVNHSLDGIKVQLRVLQRAGDAFPHQIRIAGIVAARPKLRLADADDADAFGAHGRASFPSTMAAWYCMAKPLPACARPQFTSAIWCAPAQPRIWAATSAMRIMPVQNTRFQVST